MASPSPNIPVLTVSQLTQAIKLSLENTFRSVWLQGEITNCKLQSSGHLYFTLKDPQAQISAVMFRGEMSGMKLVPKDGAQVIVRGEINVYPPSGKYQIVVREMRLLGIGELLLKFEELKQKIKGLGWFNPEFKKPLPKFPKKIGVVTSPTGAVIQDIINILSRRFSGFQLILNPVRVQGEGAAYEIAQAIRQFNQYNLVDVLIVGRGGGSLEDLWAFNEEVVAQAIFESRIPVISAVGHETDHCIADYVADVRAPTPSAAAEIVMAEKAQCLLHLEQTKKRLLQTISHLIRKDRMRLEGIRKQPIFQSPYNILAAWIQRLDELRTGIREAVDHSMERKRLLLSHARKQLAALQPTVQIRTMRHKLLHYDRAINYALKMRLSHDQKLLVQKTRMLHAIDPRNLLTKGYCIAFAEKDNSIITSVNAVEPEAGVRLLVADGTIKTIVKELCPHE